jgi:predicted nucleic acid-binding protein
VASIFVDTGYHVALIDSRDQLHEVAKARGEALRLSRAAFVTTESVLVEFLTYFSGGGDRIRLAAVEYVEDLRSAPEFTILAHDSALFHAGLGLYRARADKSYSMTDCMSMVVCRERDIVDVLTYDHDFEQEGFVAMLRRASP